METFEHYAGDRVNNRRQFRQLSDLKTLCHRRYRGIEPTMIKILNLKSIEVLGHGESPVESRISPI